MKVSQETWADSLKFGSKIENELEFWGFGLLEHGLELLNNFNKLKLN